jgi:xanthine dehydrogenase accessory factor
MYAKGLAVYDWPARALDAIGRGDAALVTILATDGSVPREAGTRMIVTRDRIEGTIGGGNLEYRAIDQARRLLDEAAGAWRVQDYPLGPLLGQCCGGRVRLLIEHLDPARAAWIGEVRDGAGELETIFENGGLLRSFFRHPCEGRDPSLSPAATPFVERDMDPRLRGDDGVRWARPLPGDRLVERIGSDLTPLHLFGAGHVGAALARILPGLPLALHWFDSRDDVAGAESVTETTMVEQARSATGPILVMTHDHALDYRLVAAALAGRAPFVGLIGSATKRARFLSRLRKDGFDDAALARLHCPIGAAGISGKEPEVIAIAVAAQLLMQRNGA